MSRVFVDSNLLCLLVAGLFAPEAVGRHKRLKIFDKNDFERVYQIISEHSEVASCPHVLTEASNLLGQTHDSEAGALRQGLKNLLQGMRELQISSIFGMDREEYPRLGLTDAVILALQDSNANLLTVDLGLTLAAQRAGLPVLNYNWIRDAYQ